MWHKNQFSLEPGTYRNKADDAVVVVTELVTHEWRPLQMDQFEREHPLVVYRDLTPKAEKYVTQSMLLNDFREKFVRA